MLPVEIHPIQDSIVLRARGSELLILSSHVAELKKLKSAGDFSRYFLHEALVNRPARKLFEAWLRKDGSLWARIYKTVQTIESSGSETNKAQPKADVVPTKVAKQPEQPKESTVKSAKKSDSPSKPVTKTSSKTEDKAAAAKPKKEKAAATKTAPKKVSAKPAAKPTAKASSAKSAPKKSAKK